MIVTRFNIIILHKFMSDDDKLAKLAESAKVQKAVGPLLKALQAAAGNSTPQNNGNDGKGKGL